MYEKKYYSAEEIEEGKMPEIDIGLFSKQLLQNLRANRKIAYAKIGGKTYYTTEDIYAYINANSVQVA